MDIEDGKFYRLSHKLLNFCSEMLARFSSFSLDDYAVLRKTGADYTLLCY
jgi:hypothetical protein